ncbi:putative Exosome complex exonuclease RRP41 [Monocercomonoides exilis]|uniref:putative Exosome complex exonuclease RRP41 n=1 Tax=Monocercomonoides exilis TaxID=2049356 RepID=UPI003559E5E6|nr:putative Exosome complex exonuclease RRP41 [Monocercomonoides exilis]|eukprot:MONOS_13831.1-p1 / transcript=MONOS_13831.1 / gene=MONOS_13831 / organism=Monocercomonoides_exilis_PA203 / gene_product=Exosome complex exonuclease RRP41 / transcript_product=Exosome complex exonuclease RRP41 / location=Mono_scaffold00890:22320-23445(-) / protein_length=246 / sequence_SO=supercontig / SO=protein_coding / is_pseudo=false
MGASPFTMFREPFLTENFRRDGRTSDELRLITCELGIYPSFDGSAVYTQGTTKILATVSGPKSSKLRSFECRDKASVNTSFFMSPFSSLDRKITGRYDKRSKEIGIAVNHVLESAILLEQMPRSVIEVNITSLEDDGATRCACINAAMLALVDAGVPLRGFVTACDAGFIEDTPFLDLTSDETNSGGAELSLAIMDGTEEVLMLQSASQLPEEQLSKVMALALEGCNQIAELLLRKIKNFGEKKIN